MGNHSTNGLEEDFRGGAVMEGTRLLRVHNMAFVEEVVVTKLQVYVFKHASSVVYLLYSPCCGRSCQRC